MYGRAATMQGASPQIALTPNATPVRTSGGSSATPWVVVGLVALFFVWAMIEHHSTRVSNALRPQAIGINVRNIAVIMLPVIIGINVLKIAAVKYKAWSLPGADTVVAIFGNL